MKSAVNKSALHGNNLPTTSPLSHIPLPRRKNSSKGDKGLDVDDTDSEFGNDAAATRSQGKMSLLGSTSFCCTSGQKEDYIPDVRIAPALRPPKKRPPNSNKKEAGPDSSTPKTPLLSAGRGSARNRKGQVNQDCVEDIQVLTNDNSSIKSSQDDIKGRLGNHGSDHKLRPVEEKRKITPPSPQRRNKEPGIVRKDPPDIRRYSDVMRKFRKDSNVCVPNQILESSGGNAKKCKHTNDATHGYSNNEKLQQTVNSRSIMCPTTCIASVSEKSNTFKNESAANVGINSELDAKEVLRKVERIAALPGYVENFNNSKESDDFDCPCCDRTPVAMDGTGQPDMEIKMFTSCDVIPPDVSSQELSMKVRETFDNTDSALHLEVKSLKEDLQAEKMKLKTQQDTVQHLEEELSVMQQLREELDKEKELRKIAEDKLLELLDYEKKMDLQKRESERRMESRGTQMDSMESVLEHSMSENSSPLLLGYDGRLRKYQIYIAKLEKDNLMLVNELKKFKDMSPRSQEEQAKVLVEKLGQMERNNHQQQMQYETCLDEVANKLVQTLLAQKRLEEECKVLHLRVEQLEQENGTLMEFIEDDKDEKVEKANVTTALKTVNAPSPNSNLLHRKPSHHPLTSSPAKKNSVSQKSAFLSDDRKNDSTKSTNLFIPVKSTRSEPKSPITSPVSPSSKQLGCSSKIPAFSSSKPVLVRKKSEADMGSTKNRNDVLAREVPSSDLLPNRASSSALMSPKSKLPSSSKSTKSTSAKRKRLSRNGSPAEKGAKDSKQRIKSNQMRWDHRKVSPEDMTPPFRAKDCISEISPIQPFPPQQQVWSFNCEVSAEMTIPEIKRKVADSIDEFSNKLLDLDMDNSEIFNDKQQLTTSESSTTIEGGNRTRDEGYSTMSSDLQPDSSAADTTISEPDHSATYVITEKDGGSDDSVTECLDGSMCSSSDSGFGPLHQVATLKFVNEFPTEEEPNPTIKDLPKFELSTRKQGTVRSKEQIASVKPTIRSTSNVCEQSQKTLSSCVSDPICDTFLPHSLKFNHSPGERNSSIITGKAVQDFGIFSSPNLSNERAKLPLVDQGTMMDYWNFPKEILGLTNYRKSWHLGPTKTGCDDQIVFCTRHSYIDDNIFDEKVETAEKATLTEPEEEMWREKALAPFIDESIWSLYSSEGDIQVKHFPLEPLLSEPSLEKLITNCSPCIIVTENIEGKNQTENFDDFKHVAIKSSNNSSATDLNNPSGQNSDKFKSGLERVASDTVLYLKDAIHELEDSMRRGLKSSKNIPALHQNSESESETSPSRILSFKPELLRTLEASISGQEHLAWPSPSRSSSTSSLQSSISCHVISDEMEDVDIIRTSRKGSQDPDLSSASDAEYENLEHKDFVERWLQKEIVSNTNLPKTTISHLEPVAEIGEFSSPAVKSKTSFSREKSESSTPFHPRMRFKCSSDSTPSSPLSSPTNNKLNSGLTVRLEPTSVATADNDFYLESVQNGDSVEEGDFESLDSEAKEFNGDFYTLCSIGSLKSLDRFSPAKTKDMTVKQLSESPVFSRKAQQKVLPAKPDKLKPTGLVKPTRPVTLAVSSVPSVPEHSKLRTSPSVSAPSRYCSPSNPISGLERISKSQRKHEEEKCDIHAKTNVLSKVPPSLSVFQAVGDPNIVAKSPNGEISSSGKSPLSSLPSPLSNVGSCSVKPKSPTKIVIRNGSPSKCEDLSKRHQWKRDRIVARQNRLKEGCGTAWIHLQPNPSFSDPSVRSSLLDSIKAPTSSSGSSSSTEEEDSDVLVIQTNSHLHRICKERRHKAKASANNPLYDMRKRSSIMGRREIFYRFGDKEKEAIACFDFLEEIPSSSAEALNRRVSGNASEELLPVPASPPSDLSLTCRKTSSKERISLISPTFGSASKMAATSDQPSNMADLAKLPFSDYSARKLRLPNLWNKPLSHNMSSSTLNSQDCELLDHISLSDSCAESYSSTPESFDDAS